MRKSLIKSFEKKLNSLSAEFVSSTHLLDPTDHRFEELEELILNISRKISEIANGEIQELKNFSPSKGFLVEKTLKRYLANNPHGTIHFQSRNEKRFMIYFDFSLRENMGNPALEQRLAAETSEESELIQSVLKLSTDLRVLESQSILRGYYFASVKFSYGDKFVHDVDVLVPQIMNVFRLIYDRCEADLIAENLLRQN